MRFAFPLISIVGTCTAGLTYLPLWALNNALRLELTLNSAANAITNIGSTAGTSYTVTGATLMQTLVTVSDVASAQIQAACGGKFDFNSSVWRVHKSIQPSAQMTNTITIPARCDSVRSVLTCMIESANRENAARLSNYERIRNGCNFYTYKIGAAMANPTPVDCITGNGLQAYMEARRVFGSVSAESCPTLLTAVDFAGTAALAPAVSAAGTRDYTVADHPSFIIPLEAQPFSQVPGLISGTSTLANSIYLDLVFATSPAAADVITAVEADALFSVDANIGTFTVRF